MLTRFIWTESLYVVSRHLKRKREKCSPLITAIVSFCQREGANMPSGKVSLLLTVSDASFAFTLALSSLWGSIFIIQVWLWLLQVFQLPWSIAAWKSFKRCVIFPHGCVIIPVCGSTLRCRSLLNINHHYFLWFRKWERNSPHDFF